MLEWVLLIAISNSDATAIEIARFESEGECDLARIVIQKYGEKAAENRGKGQPADLYGICKNQENGDSRHTSAITE